MYAIQVKILPATGCKPTRVKAWTNYDGSIVSITQSYSYELREGGNQSECAINLAKKLNLKTKMIGGSLPNGDYVFLLTENSNLIEVK